MSAIFGLVNFDGCPVSQGDLAPMDLTPGFHGRHGGGTWIRENTGLGHRLMRVTPEDLFDTQPAFDSGKRHVLVSDARIDNRLELAETLGIPASESKSMPDSAFILRAWDRWGTDCPAYLTGAYAFALHDAANRQTLIACSPMGERPLFFHASAKRIAFASAPRALFALPFIPREIDEQSFADFLAIVPPEPFSSLFAGVKRLEGGHFIVIRNGRFEVKPFWVFDPDKRTHFSRDEDYVEAFTALFTRVIRDQTRSASKVGVMMSGGLDSTAVAAVAAQILGSQGKRLETFTSVPPENFHEPMEHGYYADETSLVQAMASRYPNINLHLIRGTGQFCLDDIDAFLNASETPFRNASNRIWWESILREASERKVGVILTGLPGNLTVSWDGHDLLPHLLRSGQWKRAFREARALSRNSPGRSALRILLHKGLMPILPENVWLTIQRTVHSGKINISARPPWSAYSAIHPAFAAHQRVAERALGRHHSFYQRPTPDFWRMRYELTARNGFGGAIAHGYKGMFGVETRHVLGDVRLFEFCLSLPEDQSLKDGISRRLIRRAMKDRLPAEVLSNSGRGIQAADWFDTLKKTRPRLEDELARLASSPRASRMLDLNRVAGLLKRVDQAGPDSRERTLLYCNVIDQCIMGGRFLRWFEENPS